MKNRITPRRIAVPLIALALVLGILAAVAASLPPKPVDPPEASTSELAARADALFDQGRWREAGDVYQELLGRFEQAGDKEGIARVLVSRSTVLSLLERASEAEAGLRRALELLPSIEEGRRGPLEAKARDRLGVMLFDLGRPEEGTAELRKAQDFWRRTGQPAREVEALRNLGHGLRESGDFEAALAVLREAREVQSRHLPDDPIADGDLLCLKAAIELGQGRFQDALIGFHKAGVRFEHTGDFKRSVGTQFLIATVEFSAGREQEGVAAFQKALALSRRLDESSFMAQYLRLYELVTLTHEGRLEVAAELCSRILPFWEKSGDRRQEALIRGHLGLLHLALNRWKEGSEELSRSVEVFESAPAEDRTDPSDRQFFFQLKTLAFVSRMVAARPKMPAAQREVLVLKLREMLAKQSASQGGFHGDFEQRSQELLAQLAKRDQEGLLHAMDDLIGLLEGRGKTLTESGLKAGFFAQFSWVYSYAVEFHLAAGESEAAFDYAEKARARAFAEEIGNQRIVSGRLDEALAKKERDLRLLLARRQKAFAVEKGKPLNERSTDLLEELAGRLEETQRQYEALRLRLRVTNPEHTHLVGLDALGLTEIQGQVLDDRTTLVEYFLPDYPMSPGVRGQAVAWVIERDRFAMVPLPVSTVNLEARIELFRNLLESQQPVEVQAAELYRDLFAPLVPYIRHPNVVLVPHGVLHFLPFAALWDGKRHLGDAYTLSYSPSATTLKFAREKTARPVGPILALGNPEDSLSYAIEEAKIAAGLYGDEPLLKSAATEKALFDRAGQHGILHLAAHAELNTINPLFTSIKLAPDGGHDGNLEMHEVYGLNLSKTGLVVLSGCNTQMGKLSRGDEIEGLTRAFLYAGTPAVMSSLWKVDDESTTFFMERFYIHLRQGEGRSESLQTAQAETRVRFPHPYDWAAFVLTGDGR